MRKDHRRQLLLGAAAGAVVVTAGLAYLVSRELNNPNLIGYWSYLVAELTAGGSVVSWIVRYALKDSEKGGVSDPDENASTPEGPADRLASAVCGQWKKVAESRGLIDTSIPVTWGKATGGLGPPPDETGNAPRAPLVPRLDPEAAAELTTGGIDDLHVLYGGLPSGRLIIAGKPGSGKTTAAILLVLEALRYRKEVATDAERDRVPVPVLFTLQDWDPVHERVESWLIRKVQDSYPPFRGRAGAKAVSGLIARHQIAVILDGLDELSPDLRHRALRELSWQTNDFRLVILSRVSEMMDGTRQTILTHSVAVELQPVGAAEAVEYLRRNRVHPLPHDWRELFDWMQSSSGDPLVQALSIPLTLSLVHDTCDDTNNSIRSLLEFRNGLDQIPDDKAVELITDHLLDRVLPHAYEERPEESLPYDLDTAQHTLNRIAERMHADHVGDLSWWQVPRWVPRTQHIFASVIAGAVVAGIAGLGLVGLIIALGGGLTHVIGAMFISKAALPLIADLPKGAWVWLPLGLSYGFSVGLVDGVAVALAVVLARPIRPEPGEPRFTAARAGKTAMAALAAGIAAGLLPGLAGGLVAGPELGLGSGFLYLIATAALTAGLSNRARTSGPPPVRHNVQLKKAFGWKLATSIGGGIAVTLIVYALAILLDNAQYRLIGPAETFGEGLAFGIPAAFLLYILSSLKADPHRDKSLHPVSSRDGNRRYGRLAGLAAGLVVGFAAGLADGTVGGPVLGLASGLGFGSGLGIAIWLVSARDFSVFVASLYLRVTWKTPVRLTYFLQDAYERHVLHSVGPAYQFRHNRLQDRLITARIPSQTDLRNSDLAMTRAMPRR